MTTPLATPAEAEITASVQLFIALYLFSSGYKKGKLMLGGFNILPALATGHLFQGHFSEFDLLLLRNVTCEVS